VPKLISTTFAARASSVRNQAVRVMTVATRRVAAGDRVISWRVGTQPG
jgi:hypothetical protein